MDAERTTFDLLRDLLEVAREHEWIEVSQYCGRGCHCYHGSTSECPTCEGVEPNHKENCRTHALFQETETALRLEDEFQNGEPDRKSLWERLANQEAA